LDERGLRARTFAPRDVWRALSPTYVLMVGGVVASGLVGGMVADNALFGGRRSDRGPFVESAARCPSGKPVLTADGRMSALSEPTRARVVETFAAIPAGPARSLLADVVQRGHAVRRALVVRQDTFGRW
jgi:hypothetical protein